MEGFAPGTKNYRAAQGLTLEAIGDAHVDAKKIRRRNSAVRIGNPGPDYHLEKAHKYIDNASSKLKDKWSHFAFGSAHAHAASAMEDLPKGSLEYQDAYSIMSKAFHDQNRANPRRHVPKLAGRGRPENEAWWRFELYDAAGTHLATKGEKATARKARALAGKMRSGSFRRKKIAKVILDGPRKRP